MPMQNLSTRMEPGGFTVKIEGVDKLDAKVASALIGLCAEALDCLPYEIAPEESIQLFLTESHEGCFELIFQYASMGLDSLGDIVNQLYVYRESLDSINLFLNNLLSVALICSTVKQKPNNETPMEKLVYKTLAKNPSLQDAANRLVDSIKKASQSISDITLRPEGSILPEDVDSECADSDSVLPAQGFHDLLYIEKKKLAEGWIGRIKGSEVQVNFTRTARTSSIFRSLVPGTYIECDYAVNRRRTRDRISIDVTKIYSEFVEISRSVRARSRAALRRMRSRDE